MFVGFDTLIFHQIYIICWITKFIESVGLDLQHTAPTTYIIFFGLTDFFRSSFSGESFFELDKEYIYFLVND